MQYPSVELIEYVRQTIEQLHRSLTQLEDEGTARPLDSVGDWMTARAGG